MICIMKDQDVSLPYKNCLATLTMVVIYGLVIVIAFVKKHYSKSF